MAQVNYLDNGLIYITKAIFSAVSSVSIDNCFSADYSQYRIILDSSFSTATGPLKARLRASGSDNSTSNYREQFVNASSTTISALRRTAQTYWFNFPMHGRTNKSMSVSEVFNPFEATPTSAFKWDGERYADASNTTTQIAIYGFDASDSFDGFSLIPDTGTMTGTVYVYGYKES